MKKVFSFLLVFAFMMSSMIMLTACNGGYTLNLTQSFDVNGFKVKATSDFVNKDTDMGVCLESEGDGDMFDKTLFYIQYDLGNVAYDVQYTSVDTYIGDMVKINNSFVGDSIGFDVVNGYEKTGKLQLGNYSIVRIKEKMSDDTTQDVELRMYVMSKNINPNGDYEHYAIMCCGKTDNAFVFVHIYTSIEKVYYDVNIERLTAMIKSIEFKHLDVATIQEDVRSEISNTMVQSQLTTSTMKFLLPDNYTHEPNVILDRFVRSSTNSANELWTSSIEFYNYDGSNWGAINGIPLFGSQRDSMNARNLIKFSTSNNVGFYTKSINSDSSITYNVYHVKADGKMSDDIIKINVDYSDTLANLGFGRYFEEQMVSWLRNIEIVS